MPYPSIIKSAYTECIASAAVANGAYSAASTPVETAIVTPAERSYPELDFKIKVTSGVITSGDKYHFYRVPGDGADAEQVATGDNYIGSVEIGSTGKDFLYAVRNIDTNDKFQYLADTTNTLTASVDVRTRGIESI